MGSSALFVVSRSRRAGSGASQSGNAKNARAPDELARLRINLLAGSKAFKQRRQISFPLTLLSGAHQSTYLDSMLRELRRLH